MIRRSSAVRTPTDVCGACQAYIAHTLALTGPLHSRPRCRSGLWSTAAGLAATLAADLRFCQASTCSVVIRTSLRVINHGHMHGASTRMPVCTTDQLLRLVNRRGGGVRRLLLQLTRGLPGHDEGQQDMRM